MNYICHSGGCPGADMAWETVGYEYNVHTVSYSFYNHQCSGKNRKVLSHDELQEGYAAARLADKTLKRNFDKIQYPYVKNLLARNWFQIKNSEAIFAISRTFLSEHIVDGGTGWAVQMAIDTRKPVYVFDQASNIWFKHSINDGFVPLGNRDDVPVLTEHFAGIGTREIEENGLMAIIKVYEKNII